MIHCSARASVAHNFLRLRTNHLKSGFKNLDFHLANHRSVNQSYAMGKPRGDKVYLSSTSSTVILDDAKIPTIKALRDANRNDKGTRERYGNGKRQKSKIQDTGTA
ncbi:hypothetical protein Tco_0018455 [Tanacetum coccineum]